MMKRIDLGPQTLVYPMPALLVGTYDAGGKPNVMTAAWGGICCSTPPCLAVSVRTERHTYAAILARRCFTAGVPSVAMAAAVDYAGMASGAREDKFAVAALEAVRAANVDAPYAAQCPVVLECRLAQSVELGSHTQFIGEIVNVSLMESCLSDGKPDIAKIDPLIFDGGQRRYHCVGAAAGGAFSIGRSFMGRG